MSQNLAQDRSVFDCGIGTLSEIWQHGMAGIAAMHVEISGKVRKKKWGACVLEKGSLHKDQIRLVVDP